MSHPEVALHPIHGPDGSTVYPVGHPFYRAGDEKLPSAWPQEFVDEMVAGGFAAKPGSAAAKAIKAEREAADDSSPDAVSARIAAGCVPPTIVQTGVRG